MVQRTDSNTGVVSLNPTCQNESMIGEGGNMKPPHNVNFPRKKAQRLRIYGFCSGYTLEIEYAAQFL